MTRIAVYQDYVHNNGSLAMALQALGHEVVQMDAAGIAGGGLSSGIGALVMPGGADLYYCEKLNGAGNAAIRAYVAAGGAYLGICAGAYYGCAALNWDNGAIDGERELGFVDAVATGPVLDFIQQGDIEQSWYGAITLTTAGGASFKTLYAAGPLFEKLEGGVEVLASYAQGPAVIARAFGRGRVVLSSPHIEVSGDCFANGRYTHNARHYAHEQAVAAQLLPDTAQQRAFFKAVIDGLICA